MSAVIPSVHVYMKRNPINSRPGMAGKVALIGAFDSDATEPMLFTGLDEIQETFGSDKTYNGCKVVPYIFKGASTVLAVNYTTKTGTGAQETVDKTLTVEKLTNCLSKIKGEDWDILFISELLSDTFLPIITTFLDECFEIKYPAGYIGALTGSTTGAYITSAGLAGEHCYGLLHQAGGVNGVDVSLLEFAAYYCALIASMNVGNSMTMKAADGVTSINPEYTFETGDSGKALVEAGLTTFKCQNRDVGRYIVVNSEQPNGLDLYINRTRNFVVKEFALHEFLGDRNRNASLSEIEQEIDKVKENCVNALDLLEDIKFEVVKKSSGCVDVHITELLFAGIITRINVYISLVVE